jgi:hypothetical protein
MTYVLETINDARANHQGTDSRTRRQRKRRDHLKQCPIFADRVVFSARDEQTGARRIDKTPLFKEAQQRVATLRKMEAQRFSQAVKAYEASKPGAKLMFKVEQAPQH